MVKTVGIVTPKPSDPDCTLQLVSLNSFRCSLIVNRGDDAPKVFRANVFEEVRDGDLLVASKLEDFARNTSEIILFIRQALERNLHVVTADGQFDSRISDVRKAVDASLSMIKYYNGSKSADILLAAKAKGVALGRKRRFTESDWPRIYNKLLVRPMSVVAKEEGVARTTLQAFYDRMTAE